jgi:DHA2 family multidrug resistance protein
MVFAGRLAFKIDPRLLMGAGVSMLLWSIWEMSRWTPDISVNWLIFVTFIQGIGMGYIFVPMNLVGFATLSPVYRTDASAVLNLMRNIGMAIGVSITTTVLASSVQTAHAQLAEHVSPFNRALGVNAQGMMYNPQMPFGVQNLNHVIEYNAQVIAYANDFLFMFFISLPAIIVILFMKKPQMLPGAPKPEAVAME